MRDVGGVLLVIVGVTAYDGWPANESDYWVRVPLCGGPSRCVAASGGSAEGPAGASSQ